jgi:hypothetical protein
MDQAPYYAEAFLADQRPLLPNGHPTGRRSWPDPLPRAGRLARVLAGPKRSPLPDRGLRGPPTNPRRGQPPHRLASGRAVAAGTQVQEHPAALPLDFVVILSLAQ